jgi:hypothetical protein
LVFLDQTEYARQIGRTSMTDFRWLWKGDFEPVGMSDDGAFQVRTEGAQAGEGPMTTRKAKALADRQAYETAREFMRRPKSLRPTSGAYRRTWPTIEEIRLCLIWLAHEKLKG